MEYRESKSVTLKDVARALGVSHVTVSLALRNDSRISDARISEVKAKAEELGYRPNAMATALAHFRQAAKVHPDTASIAWLNFWENPSQLRGFAQFESYWTGATAAANRQGYHLDEFICNEGGMTLPKLESVLMNRGIIGILVPPQRLAKGLDAFGWEKFHAVRFGRSVAQPRLHMVTGDQVANAMIAFERVRALGYRRIGYVFGRAFTSGALFQAGYLMAQQTVPKSEQLPLLELPNPDRQKNQKSLEQWMERHKPDAILTSMDELPSMLAEAGYSVPRDVGLATMNVLDGGCDAGINQNPEEIGRVAMLVLMSLIHDGARGVPKIFRQILIEGYWVDGSSMPSRL